MSETIYYFVLAAILLALVPIVPQMIRLRIKFLNFLRWRSLADWHQRHFRGFVLAARIVMASIAVVLFILGITG